MGLFWDVMKYGVPTLGAVAGYGFAKGRGMTLISAVGVSAGSWLAGYGLYRVADRLTMGSSGSLPSQPVELPGETQEPIQTSTADDVQSAVAGRAGFGSVTDIGKYNTMKRGKDGQPGRSGDSLSSLSSSSLGSTSSSGSGGSV